MFTTLMMEDAWEPPVISMRGGETECSLRLARKKRKRAASLLQLPIPDSTQMVTCPQSRDAKTSS
ncbi:hypothetical protein SAMN06265222_110166 [Neorhodopirellula lusitana]|uniref:Uncharacterized protein n=1 Tax=Neorhodopirellula lusitana TaxID=445327 RepID=A0ABY1QCN7_9BACT|nr:hypothetical protein SAMN06265222_110166 [Neorhodopirellula lusitana]